VPIVLADDEAIQYFFQIGIQYINIGYFSIHYLKGKLTVIEHVYISCQVGEIIEKYITQ
jgi:hypothetical protein